MSSTDQTTEDARRQVGHVNRSLLGMLRLMVVTVTSKPLWQGLGVRLIDMVTKETVNAPNFSGIGFYARPRPGANAEEIVAHVGGSENPVIVATRDEKLRSEMANIDENETATFNGLTIAIHRKTGAFEIRTASGIPLALPTMADFNALRAQVDGHVHLYAPGPGTPVATTVPTTTSPPPTGTVVLKTE